MKINSYPTIGLKSTWRWRIKMIFACLGCALGLGLVVLFLYAWVHFNGWFDVAVTFAFFTILIWAVWGFITIVTARRK